MEIVVIIGSLRSNPWHFLRDVLSDTNYVEISNDYIYFSWNKRYIPFSEIVAECTSFSKLDDSVVDRTWFFDLVFRWTRDSVPDLMLIKNECSKLESSLAQYLSKFTILKSIGLYGIAHHLWNNIVESALNSLKVPTFKFYPLLDTNYSILLCGYNELNSPFKVTNFPFEWSVPDQHLFDSLYTSLVQCNPQYTIREISLGSQFLPSNDLCRYDSALFAIKNLVNSTKFLFHPAYDPFSFSVKLRRRRTSITRYAFAIASQSNYFNLYDLSANTYNYELMRGQLIVYANFQPEATTCPEGGKYHSHLRLIIRLKELFPDKLIFYKEHPASSLAYSSNGNPTYVGLNRSVNYLDSLMALGVKLIPRSNQLDLATLIQYEITPITINGTIALQSALLGKTAIFAGHPWYEHFAQSLPLFHIDNREAKSCLSASYLTHQPDTSLKLFSNFLQPYVIPNVFNFGKEDFVADSESIPSAKELLGYLLSSV